jgi:hypothetical protein
MATRDSRDVGFPQISTRGLYGTFGDPNMPAGERVPARWFDATAFNSRINGSGF